MSGKRKWLGVAAIVMICAFFLWRGPSLYSHYREQRLTAQAQRFLEAGRYREASLSAQQLHQLNPRNVDACRIMAELTERARDPSTITWRRQVAELSPTLENRLMLAAAAILFERPPYPLAQQTLEEIRALGPTTAPYHLIAAQLALKQNHYDEAQAHYEQAIKLEPQKESHQMNLAVLRLQSQDLAVATDARTTLERLCSSPKLGAFAMRSLVIESVRRNDRERALEFSEQLLIQPSANFGDRVQHLSILHGVQNPTVENFLSALRQEAATNELAVYQLANWMTGRGMAYAALAWIEALPPEMQARQPVPKAVVEGLLARKDWPSLESFLNGQQWQGQDFVRVALTALTLRNQDLEDSAKLKLQEAVRLATGRVENLTILSEMFESWGWQTEAEETLELVVTRFPQDRRASEAVCLAYYAKGNTTGLLRVLVSILKAHPGEMETANNMAMVSLLLNTNLSQAHLLAEQAYISAPSNSVYASTRAFSLHLQGRHAEALELFHTLRQTELERASVALYYSLALAASGEMEQAQKYLALAVPTKLLPEEKRLWEQLSSSAISGESAGGDGSLPRPRPDHQK